MLVATWSIVGCTPTLKAMQSRAKASAIGALTSDGRLLMRIHEDSIASDLVVEFLRHLLRHIAGPILVVWDNASFHRSDRVREFLAALPPGRLRLEALPPYAPELNPIEYLWNQMKRALGNVCCADMKQLLARVRRVRRELQSDPELLLSFLSSYN